VDLQRARVALAPGIEVAVEIVAGEAAVDEFDAGDLDDSVPSSGSNPVVSVSNMICRMCSTA